MCTVGLLTTVCRAAVHVQEVDLKVPTKSMLCKGIDQVPVISGNS